MTEFITKDLYIAGYLLSHGCRVSSHESVDGITFFHFQRSEKLDGLVESYFASEALVNPLEYDRAVESLQTLALGPKARRETALVG